jgi:hypothetical protein
MEGPVPSIDARISIAEAKFSMRESVRIITRSYPTGKVAFGTQAPPTAYRAGLSALIRKERVLNSKATSNVYGPLNGGRICLPPFTSTANFGF